MAIHGRDEGTPIQDGRVGNNGVTRSQKKQKSCFNKVLRVSEILWLEI